LSIVLGFLTFFPNHIDSAGPYEKDVSRETDWTFDTFVHHLALKYGQDEELARKIIACESQYKQGNTHKNLQEDGTVWSTDWGYWQINDYWHLDEAKSQGYDIRYNWQHNLEYGFKMLKSEGTTPWNASKYCWNK